MRRRSRSEWNAHERKEGVMWRKAGCRRWRKRRKMAVGFERKYT